MPDRPSSNNRIDVRAVQGRHDFLNGQGFSLASGEKFTIVEGHRVDVSLAKFSEDTYTLRLLRKVHGYPAIGTFDLRYGKPYHVDGANCNFMVPGQDTNGKLVVRVAKGSSPVETAELLRAQQERAIQQSKEGWDSRLEPVQQQKRNSREDSLFGVIPLRQGLTMGVLGAIAVTSVIASVCNADL